MQASAAASAANWAADRVSVGVPLSVRAMLPSFPPAASDCSAGRLEATPAAVSLTETRVRLGSANTEDRLAAVTSDAIRLPFKTSVMSAVIAPVFGSNHVSDDASG